jgi:hypothetical protein
MTEDVKKKNDRDDMLDHWSTAIKMFVQPWPQTNHKRRSWHRDLVSRLLSLPWYDAPQLEHRVQLRNFKFYIIWATLFLPLDSAWTFMKTTKVTC